MKKLEDKLDKLSEMQGEMNVTLAKQSVILEEHVKRTNLLEAKITPIERHVAMVNGALKLLGVLALIIGLIEGLRRL